MKPLTSEETGKAVVTASEMTKADVDNTLQQGNGFVQGQKEAQQVSEVQQAHPDIKHVSGG